MNNSYLTVKQKYSFLAVFWFVTNARSKHFFISLCFVIIHQQYMFNKNLKIADNIYYNLIFFGNTQLKKCRNYGNFCFRDVTLVINGLSFYLN